MTNRTSVESKVITPSPRGGQGEGAAWYDLGPDVVAFSTLRRGSVDPGRQAARADVAYNGFNQWRSTAGRLRLADRLGIGPDDFVVPHQTHSDHVLRVSLPGQPDDVDAVFTTEPRLCVCVSTADCIPVLLHDTARRAVAAIHAGWRGTVEHIVEKTLQAMYAQLGTEATDVRAVIGPGIGRDAFEVGDEVYEAFLAAGFPMERIAERRAKWHIDLSEANRLQLQACGVRDIRMAGICTYTHADRFYSARRLGIQAGRILNGIMIKDMTI